MTPADRVTQVTRVAQESSEVSTSSPRAPAVGWIVTLGLGIFLAATSHAADPWIGLIPMSHVAVDVIVDPAHAQVTRKELAHRVAEALRAGAPGLRIDPEAPDVLRLTIGVRRVSSTELRGYYLPFSGAYGLGIVGLALVRRVTVPGLADTVPAIVWQREQLARAPWGESGTEVRAHLEGLLGAFLEDYRRAAARPE
jgi:hypothetical protein